MKEALGIESSNDTTLVELSRNGDRDAFGRIVERYQSLVCALTYSACGNFQKSEDLAQVTFITAWCQLPKLKEPSKLKSWLCGIARNIVNDSFRQDQRAPTARAENLDSTSEITSTAPTPRDHVISKEEEAILWRSLGELPPMYREPLVLFYRQHQSTAEIASALDVSEDVARQRLSRGRAMLTEKVTAFIEGALRQTSPDKAFTLAVLAVLPGLAISTKAATVGATAAKGSATAKAAAATGVVGAILGPLLFCIGGYAGYRLELDQAQSDGERRYIRSYYRKIAASALGVFVALIAFLFWLCRNQYGYSLLIELSVTGLIVIGLLTTFVFAIGSYRGQRRYLSNVLAKEHGGRFPKPAWEYRSKACLFGLPLIHIRVGDRFGMLRKPVTAWIAIGHYAVGVLFAFGGIAVAPASVGFCAVGLLPFGAVAMGLIALGGFGIGLWTFAGLALGWQAFGGCAFGWKAALGGIALAHDFALGGIAYGGPMGIEPAKAFIQSSPFLQCAQGLLPFWFWLYLLWVVPLFVFWRIVVHARLSERANLTRREGKET